MKVCVYLYRLIRLALTRQPSLAVCLLLSLGTALLELLALSSLFPLTALAAGLPLPTRSPTARALHWIGVEPAIPNLLIVFAALYGARLIVEMLNRCLGLYMTKQLMASLSCRTFANIFGYVRLDELEQKSSGYYINLLVNETHRASALLVALTDLASLLFLAGLCYLAILWYSLTAGFGVLLFLALTAVAMLGSLRQVRRLGDRLTDEGQQNSSVFIDSVNGCRAVRAFGAEDYVIGRYQYWIDRYTGTQFTIEFLNAAVKLLPVLLILTLLGLGLLASGDALLGRQGNLAAMVAMLAFMMRLFPVLGQIVTLATQVLATARGGQDVNAIAGLDQARARSNGRRLAEPVTDIQLRGVGFSYDGRACVFQNVDMQFRAGRSYAVVGPSGSGKSTLADLILKFHAASEGSVLVNGVPVEQLDAESLRQRVILACQQTILFNDAVSSNIAFGRPCAAGEIERAARLASIHDFVESLPAGYATLLNYQGSNLSGGQQQRIGLARALVRRPDVLIVDEGTSALDETTARLVVNSILAEFRDRIVIFITHDGGLIQQVDEVFTLNPAPDAASPAPPNPPALEPAA